MLKPMGDDLELTRSELSLAVTCFMLVSAAALPIAGRIADRYSLRAVIAGGVVASAAGVGLMGRVTALWQAFVLYGGLYGVGNAAASTATVGVLVTRWFSHRTGLANSIAISGNAIGQLIIITTLASGLSYVGWRDSFGLLGAANVLLVLPLVLIAARSRPPRPDDASPAAAETVTQTGDETEGTVRGLLESRALWLLAVVYAICGFQDFFVATHVVAFATDEGLGPLLAGNILALMGVMGLAGVLTSGTMADAFGAARPTALCFLIRIVIFSFALSFRNTPGIVAFALGYGFTFLITAPLIVLFVRNIFGTARLGLISGLLSMVHQGSGGLGAVVGALVFDHWGSYGPAFLLMLSLSILAGAATLAIREPSPRTTAAE